MPYQPWQNPYQPNSPYQPNYMTAGGTYQMMQQPVNGIIYVTGLEGAKVMFIKTTDGAGFPTIIVVDCKRRDGQQGRSVNTGYPFARSL